jgi:hypothetical protein
MVEWDAVGMNTPMTLRRRAHLPSRTQAHARRSLRWLPWLAWAALGAWAAHLYFTRAVAGGDMAVAASPLVHWKDAKHDWLLVVDPSTHELMVYDANDGRPLRRLGAAQGVQAIDSITGEGNRLIATSRSGSRPQVFSLPDLQPMALATR